MLSDSERQQIEILIGEIEKHGEVSLFAALQFWEELNYQRLSELDELDAIHSWMGFESAWRVEYRIKPKQLHVFLAQVSWIWLFSDDGSGWFPRREEELEAKRDEFVRTITEQVMREIRK